MNQKKFFRLSCQCLGLTCALSFLSSTLDTSVRHTTQWPGQVCSMAFTRRSLYRGEPYTVQLLEVCLLLSKYEEGPSFVFVKKLIHRFLVIIYMKEPFSQCSLLGLLIISNGIGQSSVVKEYIHQRGSG